MKKIELEIVALSNSISRTQSYAVYLGEVNGLRRIPIVIGAFEAQAIAVALENMPISRPLTHDLMKNFMLAFQIDLHEIIICRLHEGVFFSKLICSSENDTIEIDSRTSDALALAVRFGCPIYIYESVLDAADKQAEIGEGSAKKEAESISVEGSESIEEATEELDEGDLKKYSTEELQKRLNEVLENEDYIRAIAIRDEIENRKKMGK